MGIFKELYFNVSQELFLEVFKNPDQGFGYTVKLDKGGFSELQIETLDFLIKCHKKNLLGAINIVFETDAIGELQKLSKRVEKIKLEKNKYILSNSL